MPAKTILTGLFLISLGVVVVLGLRALPHRVSSVAKQEILVAATALPSGTLLRAKDVTWQPIAGTAEPDQILRPPDAAGTANLELDQQTRAEVYGAALRAAADEGLRHARRRHLHLHQARRGVVRCNDAVGESVSLGGNLSPHS